MPSFQHFLDMKIKYLQIFAILISYDNYLMVNANLD